MRQSNAWMASSPAWDLEPHYRSVTRPELKVWPRREPAKPPQHFYRPELDTLRFFAFLSVFVGHSLTSTGTSVWFVAIKQITSLGLPLFFALSAFLITELLMQERRATGSINVRSFYSRRILRIWPVYFLSLGSIFLLSHTVAGPAMPIFELLAYVFLLGNWYSMGHGYLSFGMAPLWSISVEEQFYLFWPLVVRFASRRALGLICCLAWIMSQGTLLYLCIGRAPSSSVWTNSLVQLQYLAIGAGLSLILKGSIPRLPGILRAAILFTAFALSVAIGFLFDPHGLSSSPHDHVSMAHTYPIYLLVGLVVFMLLIGSLGCPSLGRFRSIRYLGKISYGMYVYHLLSLMFAFNVVRTLKLISPLPIMIVGLLVTIGLAWISYEYIERPFIRLKSRFEIVKTRAE